VDDKGAPHGEGTVIPFRRQDDQVEAPAPRMEGAAIRELADAIREAINSAEWLPKQQDLAALQHEEIFKKRFGFDANRRRRQQVLAFKHEADVTDAEIRVLKRSHCLVFSGEGVGISAPKSVAWWGCLMIFVLGLLMTLPLLKWNSGALKNIWDILIIALVEMLLLYFSKLTYDIYIRPYQIHRRVVKSR
jgi:hypothetical protein